MDQKFNSLPFFPNITEKLHHDDILMNEFNHIQPNNFVNLINLQNLQINENI